MRIAVRGVRGCAWSRARTGCAAGQGRAAVRIARRRGHALRVSRACEGGFGMHEKNGSRLTTASSLCMINAHNPRERREKRVAR